MAGIVPDASELTMLQHVLNYAAPQNQVLRLFTNNVTPDQSYTAASFTEASGGGYAAKSITGTSWVISTDGSNKGSAAYAAQTWTFTGALSGSAVIYGWYLVEVTSGLLLACERITNSFQPGTNGDQLIITPTIKLYSV